MHRILLIDDNGGVRAVLKSFLESNDFEVTTARDGEEGILLFGDGENFDAVVTDIRMPGKNGYAVARHVKGSKNRNTPVIAITGYSTDEWAEDIFDALFIKPFKFEVLKESISLFLEGS
jgi:CheY-like chemotaxis protein